MEDLGLSVMWADSNAGAETEHEVGTLFSWWDISSYHDCRLPSKAEYEELIDQCLWIWVEEGDFKGYEVVGLNDGKIYFPVQGKNTCYWSSSQDNVHNELAYALVFEGTDISVRLCDKNNEYFVKEAATQDNDNFKVSDSDRDDDYQSIESIRSSILQKDAQEILEICLGTEKNKWTVNSISQLIAETRLNSQSTSDIERVYDKDYENRTDYYWKTDPVCAARVAELLEDGLRDAAKEARESYCLYSRETKLNKLLGKKANGWTESNIEETINRLCSPDVKDSNDFGIYTDSYKQTVWMNDPEISREVIELLNDTLKDVGDLDSVTEKFIVRNLDHYSDFRKKELQKQHLGAKLVLGIALVFLLLGVPAFFLLEIDFEYGFELDFLLIDLIVVLLFLAALGLVVFFWLRLRFEARSNTKRIEGKILNDLIPETSIPNKAVLRGSIKRQLPKFKRPLRIL